MKITVQKKQIILAIALIACVPAWASSSLLQASSPHWGWLIAGLLGGLALFLYGMEKMSTGLKHSAGEKMRTILSSLTRNRIVAMMVGAFVTMVIQSSSATTVMLVSFVQAGLMNFAQSLSIILGANIGTTFTAQLIAFKLTDYAIVLIALGFAFTLFGKRPALKNIGDTLLGFGILFYGMKLMSDAMSPLRDYPEFINVLKQLENPFLGVLAGALFTALIQSSSAFTGIVIVLAQQNLISLEAGVPMIMGANIGTCFTAFLASIGASREAKRVAVAHTFYNVGGVLLFIFIVPQFVHLIQYMDRFTESGVARQIANAHTVFNLTVGLVFLPFTKLTSNLLLKILPERKDEKPAVLPAIQNQDANILKTPSLAMQFARSELVRVANILSTMLSVVISPFLTPKTPEELKNTYQSLDEKEQQIDAIEESLVDFLLILGKNELSKKQMNDLLAMMSIINDMEAIGDIIHRDLLPHYKKKEQLKNDFSPEGRSEIIEFHQKIQKQLLRLEKSLEKQEAAKAEKVIAKELSYKELEEKYRNQHLKRVQKGNTDSLKTHEVHMGIMDLLKQINVFSANIARTITQSALLSSKTKM